jgi:secreted Zn-dependent insulinase-like peptidase
MGFGVIVGVFIMLCLLLGHFFGRGRRGFAAAVVQLTDTAKADIRTYQHTVIQNGLQVLNIQDKRSNRAAFAMAVQAGSLDDPAEVPGLAHFCEHMLFLGSSRYPLPDDYRNFMSAHGGTHNAFTAGEVTVYFGEVPYEAASDALARFSDFFRAPLFNSDYVQKEVHAIDSEHAKNVQNPLRRVFETMNNLAEPGSPVSRFHTGNVETLYDIPRKEGTNLVDELKRFFKSHYCPSKMRLVTLGPSSLSEQLERVRKEFEGLHEGTSECRKREVGRSYAKPAPWPAEKMGRWVTMQGTQLQSELWLLFPLPDVRKHYKSQPLEYVNYVLTYGGENSLKRILADSLELVSTINVMTDFNGGGMSFFLTIKLTPSGREHPELVLDVLYSYLAAVRRVGVDATLYSSLADLMRLNWDWAQPSHGKDAVTDFAERLTQLPVDHLLSGSSRIDAPDTNVVEELLNQLRPENMNVVLVDPNATSSTAFSSNEVRTLPHYGVQYTVQDTSNVLGSGSIKRWTTWLDRTPESQIAKEMNAQVLSAGINATYAPKLVVPSKVVGIPKSIPMDFMKANTSLLDSATSNTTDALVQTLVGTQPLFGPRPQRLELDIDSAAAAAAAADPSQERTAGNETVNATDNITTNNTSSPENASTPRPIYDAWYRSGWMTTSPEVMVKLVMRPLKLPDEPEPTPVDVMRIGVFSRLLLEDLAPKLFDLTMTGVSYDVDVWTGGATIVLSGFGAILPGLGEKILSALDAFGKNAGTVTTLEQKRFTRITQKLTDDLQTFSNMPVSHALQDLQLLLTKGPHAAHEKLLALENVTVENAKQSVNELLCSRPMILTASVIGNIGEAEAQSMTSSFTKQLKEACMDSAAENSTYSGGEVEHITPVVKVSQPVEVRAPNPRKGDPNDAIVFSLISNVSTVERRVKLALLGQILDPLAFNELRSQRQLGYVVQAGMSQFSNVLAINCLVQSTSLGADQLEAAIEYVLTKLMIERLHTLTAKDFLGYKDSLRQMLVQPPSSIGEEMEFFWASIVKGGHCFDLRDQMLRYLDGPDVTIEALLDEWTELATPKKGMRRKVVVKYFATGVPEVPSQADAMKTWASQGVAKDTLPMLVRESEKVIRLSAADAKARGELSERFGYFSTDLKCELEPASENSLRTSKDSDLRSAEALPTAFRTAANRSSWQGSSEGRSGTFLHKTGQSERQQIQLARG